MRGNIMRQSVLAGVAAVMALALCSCGKVDVKGLVPGLKRPNDPENIPTATVENLQKGIVDYQKEADRTVDAMGHVGTYWKLLASRYIDKRMFGEALKAAQKAVTFYPDDKLLYYYIGLSAGYMSKTTLQTDTEAAAKKRSAYLALAETGYKRAIAINPRYGDALYGLSVLYVFEFNTPAVAEPYLVTLLDVEKDNIDGMFLLARVYYGEGRLDDAVKLYDRIIDRSKLAVKRQEAERNRKAIQDEQYGKK